GGCQSQLPPLRNSTIRPVCGSSRPSGLCQSGSGVTLSPQQLVARLAAAPRVIVGEKHDNPDHHAVELWLAQALGEYRAQGSLLLEMLEPGQQPRVDAVRAQLGTGKP
ncbi:ChaN family lipoprotein, partial [Pseudomonas aeruginosa]|uniref:ChaN family lipoprotein n=1 Tax=Pseudomonas aeruginosa TaxID=287 RepID=UPI003F7E3046